MDNGVQRMLDMIAVNLVIRMSTGGSRFGQDYMTETHKEIVPVSVRDLIFSQILHTVGIEASPDDHDRAVYKQPWYASQDGEVDLLWMLKMGLVVKNPGAEAPPASVDLKIQGFPAEDNCIRGRRNFVARVSGAPSCLQVLWGTMPIQIAPTTPEVSTIYWPELDTRINFLALDEHGRVAWLTTDIRHSATQAGLDLDGGRLQRELARHTGWLHPQLLQG